MLLPCTQTHERRQLPSPQQCSCWVLQMEFEDVLDMSAFSFRVPQHMIYMLGTVLHDLVVDEPRRVRSPPLAQTPSSSW